MVNSQLSARSGRVVEGLTTKKVARAAGCVTFSLTGERGEKCRHLRCPEHGRMALLMEEDEACNPGDADLL